MKFGYSSIITFILYSQLLLRIRKKHRFRGAFSLSKKQYSIFMLRAAARIQSNLLCKFINSGSMAQATLSCRYAAIHLVYLGIYTREEKMCPQDAVFLRDSLESVVSSERLFGKRSFSTASGGQPSAFWLNPSYTLQRPRCRGCRRPNPARRWRRNSPR